MKWTGMKRTRLATLKVPHPYDLCGCLVGTILNLFLKFSISKSLMTFLHKLTKQWRSMYQYNHSACFSPSMQYSKTTERISLVLAAKEQRAQPHSQDCQNESTEREHHMGQAVVTHHQRNSACSLPLSCPWERVRVLLVSETRFLSCGQQIKLLILCFWRCFSAVRGKSTSGFHSDHSMQENISLAKT